MACRDMDTNERSEYKGKPYWIARTQHQQQIVWSIREA